MRQRERTRPDVGKTKLLRVADHALNSVVGYPSFRGRTERKASANAVRPDRKTQKSQQTKTVLPNKV